MVQEPQVPHHDHRQAGEIRHRLHRVPAVVRHEGEVVDGAPPANQQSKATHRNALRATMRQLITFLLDASVVREFTTRFAETHAEIMSAVIERRNAHADLLRRAFDLHSEFLAPCGVADEVPDLGGRRPAHEFAVGIPGLFAPAAGIAFDAALAGPAAQLVLDLVLLFAGDAFVFGFLDFPELDDFPVDEELVAAFFLLVLGFVVVVFVLFDLVLCGVFGAEEDGGDFFALAVFGFNHGEFGLDEPFEVGEGLLGVDEERKWFDGFTVGVLVECGEGQNEFE
jgi:hypothetical protein